MGLGSVGGWVGGWVIYLDETRLYEAKGVGFVWVYFQDGGVLDFSSCPGWVGGWVGWEGEKR